MLSILEITVEARNAPHCLTPTLRILWFNIPINSFFFKYLDQFSAIYITILDYRCELIYN